VVVRAEVEKEGAVASAVTGPDGAFHLTVPAGPVTLRALDMEPPPELALTTHVGATLAVELEATRRPGTPLPAWPFLVTLGLFAVSAGGSVVVLGKRVRLLGGIVARPVATFAELARQPEWLGPCGLALAIASLAAMAQIRLLPGELWGALMGMAGGLATSLMLCVPILLFVAYLVAAFGSWLAWAVCLWLLAHLTGTRSRFFHVVGALGYAGVPWLLGACVAALATTWGWQEAGPWVSRVSGLALVADGSTAIHQVLARIELFSLWTWALGTVAAAQVLRTGWRRAAALNGACWILYLGGVWTFFAISHYISAGLAGGGA
jgi:hypothetical protein